MKLGIVYSVIQRYPSPTIKKERGMYMNYAVAVMMLGYTRINGVVAFNSDTKEFLEITPAVAKRMIDKDLLKGLRWKKEDEGIVFECDTEGWNQTNIPFRTACGKFRPLKNDYPGVDINSMYTVVRVLDTDYRGRLYEVVSNKCSRIKITEQNLRELAAITDIAGVWITDNEIKVADAVQYEDRRANTDKKVESGLLQEFTEVLNSDMKDGQLDVTDDASKPEEKQDNSKDKPAKNNKKASK